MQNTNKQYIEHDCTFEHEGRAFTAGGAYITDRHIIAYPKEDGILGNWRGDPIGTWKAVSTWKTPRSFMSSTMSQIEAVVNGIRYTGRGAGIGMIFKGKSKK
jgi:hypothetical protein